MPKPTDGSGQQTIFSAYDGDSHRNTLSFGYFKQCLTAIKLASPFPFAAFSLTLSKNPL